MGEREQMTKADDMIKVLESIADDACLEHKPLIYAIIECVNYANTVSQLPNCNICGKRKNCEHIPPLGTMTRINCFEWESVSK